jgi:hypothetical protein
MPRVTGLRPLMGVYNPQSRRKFCPLFTYAYLLRAARNLAHRAGRSISFPKQSPLKILSVEKKAGRGIFVTARYS